MKITNILWCALLALTLFSGKLSAQLVVNNTLTPQQLAQLISGPGVQILNPVVHSGANGYGKYNATNSNLNITEGLLLTTGTINNAVGPNNVGNKTTYFGSQNTPDTYPLLTNYTGRTIYEYCEFEFDIIPQGDTIKFDFVFASEEYEEWVGSQYNDVFGFFISGPGITGDPGAGSYHNIALLPNSTTAVTINNVNQNSNTAYYQNNNNGTSVQYDGFTKGLKAISKVTPCTSYHLKLIVADASDKLWDSGVFIEKISSNNVLLLSQTAGGIPNMVEGCNNGQIIFTRQNITSNPLTLNYWIGGNAINGTDYPLIGSSPSPSSPKTITIPANQASASITIDPISDGLSEGYEYMTVYLGNPFCSSQITDSIRFYIQDSLYTTVNPERDSICVGSNVAITTTNGGSSFSWSPAIGLSATNNANTIATPTTSTIYTLTTTASTCVMQKTSSILVSNMNLSLVSTNISCYNSNNGTINLSVSNGFPPYSYQWTGPNSYTSSLQNISSLAPGSYTVVVTDRKGCSKTTSVSLTQPTVLAGTVSSPTFNGGYNISCNSSNTGSASALVSGGVQPYSYLWSSTPTQNNSTASNLIAGTYTLTVTDANGCLLNKTITLNQPDAINTLVSAQNNVSCFNANNGSATISTTGGTSPYTYSWNTTPAQNNATATNLSTGTYIVNISDANNCSDSKTIIITQPAAALSATISSLTNVSCKGNSSGSASVTASGGTSPYTYLWSTNPAQTSSSATGLAAGNYTVTITDSKNCITSLPVNISEPATNVSAMITNQVNVSCFGGNNGSINILASGGVPGYTYSWSTSPIQTSAQAQNLSIGTYTVVIRDANNCSFNLQSTITQPTAALSSSISSQTNVLCRGNNSGSATINPLGGTAPYTYTWSTSPAQTGATGINLSAGNYTVVVKDSKNCTVNQLVTITQPASSVSSNISSQNNVLCFGLSTGSATVNASGGVSPYTYNWNSSPVQTSATANALAAGNYTVTVKDANNCTSLSSVTISQPIATLGISITNVNHVKCKSDNTGSATAVASGGSGSYSYSWNSTPTQLTPTAISLPTGTYTATITDNNGCTNPVTQIVTISEPLNFLTSNLTSPQFNGYNIACKNGNNGAINNTSAGGTSPYIYSWLGSNSFNSAQEDLSSISVGVYSLTVTDANNCTFNTSITLTEPNLITVNATTTAATCPSFNDGEVALTVSGGTPAFLYQWAGPSSFSSTTSTISNLVAGNYSLTVTDLNSCTFSEVYTVTQPGTLAITYTVSSYLGGNNISCFGGTNGNIGSVNVTGGTPLYNYSWTGPAGYTASTANITALSAGNYQLVVTDNNGCTTSSSIILSEAASVSNVLTPTTYFGDYNISCKGFSDGSISVVSSGGTASYTHEWNGPLGFNSISQNISSLVAGTYTLTTTDVNACTGISTIQLTEPNPLISTLSSTTYIGGNNIKCFGENNGAIDVQTSGGTSGYNYLWTGPSSFNSSLPSVSNLIAGTYTLVLSDANNCTYTNSITLTEPSQLIATSSSATFVGANNISCFGLSDGSINLNVTGGTANYLYSWTGTNAFTSSNQNLNNLSAGSYSVQVSDANSCLAVANINLTQPVILTTEVISTTFNGNYNISCNGLSDGSINLLVNGGIPNYTYNWSGPSGYFANTQNINGLIAGSYSVSVVDENGCSSSASIILSEPSAMSANITSTTYVGGYNITCNGYNNGSIVLTNSGGTPNYVYNWSGPLAYVSNDQNPSGLVAGNYNVTVTDANNCLISSNITLSEPATLTGSISSPTINGGYNITCNGNNNGSIQQLLNGGTLPYSIIWNNGSTTQDISNLSAGFYSVIVTDTNNCSITQSITLTEPEVLFASAVSLSYHGGNNIKCNGDSNGEINLGIIGGTMPYITNWNGPNGFNSNSTSITGLAAGTYSYTVSDNNSCNVGASLTLIEPLPLTSTLTTASYAGNYNISCNGENDGSISGIASGGTRLINMCGMAH
ncbi:MAG: choice-of-anchor L domain-containing protein [Bacteroidetes bacterium]|nr:choice-of-anchor L domain-containing protein [Bacteroidota bacterium]